MSPCIEADSNINNNGYARCVHSGKRVLRHRVVYCQHNGVTMESIKDLVVRHKCDNRKCINGEHLELGTHADNAKDRDDRGRTAKGEKNSMCKLTDDQVRQIKLRSRDDQAELAKEFGVHRTLISMILLGKTRQEVI